MKAHTDVSLTDPDDLLDRVPKKLVSFPEVTLDDIKAELKALSAEPRRQKKPTNRPLSLVKEAEHGEPPYSSHIEVGLDMALQHDREFFARQAKWGKKR